MRRAACASSARRCDRWPPERRPYLDSRHDPDFSPLVAYVPLRKRTHHEILGSPINLKPTVRGELRRWMTLMAAYRGANALAAHVTMGRTSSGDQTSCVVPPLVLVGRQDLTRTAAGTPRRSLRERQSPVATFEAASGKDVGPGADRQGCAASPQSGSASRRPGIGISTAIPASPAARLNPSENSTFPGNRQRLVAAPCKQGFLCLRRLSSSAVIASLMRPSRQWSSRWRIAAWERSAAV